MDNKNCKEDKNNQDRSMSPIKKTHISKAKQKLLNKIQEIKFLQVNFNISKNNGVPSNNISTNT